MAAIAILKVRPAEAQAALPVELLAHERDPNAPVPGSPEGDVTVVAFFDDNCRYCRRAKPSIGLAQALGITATPSFVIGDTLVPGVVDVEHLRTLVSDAR
ncbi:thioredoxin domain-containing protein [Roseovarius gahaiensis]|uniref:hypothetical protein n=1 Tax=Roseovarius gahaiensis TaxID=2716691 RepID=UPI002F2B1A86